MVGEVDIFPFNFIPKSGYWLSHKSIQSNAFFENGGMKDDEKLAKGMESKPLNIRFPKYILINMSQNQHVFGLLRQVFIIINEKIEEELYALRDYRPKLVKGGDKYFPQRNLNDYLKDSQRYLEKLRLQTELFVLVGMVFEIFGGEVSWIKDEVTKKLLMWTMSSHTRKIGREIEVWTQKIRKLGLDSA